LDPHYKQPLEDTFTEAGLKFVTNRAEANFVFEGDCKASRPLKQIFAFFKDGDVALAGASA